MVQYRAISKKTLSSAQLQEIFESNVLNIRNEVLEEMAIRIANASPVDTGTYARGHRVGRRSGSFTSTESSHGKPRNVPEGPPRAEGLDAMRAGINMLPPDAKNIVFRNTAVHAKYVERGRQGVGARRVYETTRSEFSNIINDALAKLGMKTR